MTTYQREVQASDTNKVCQKFPSKSCPTRCYIAHIISLCYGCFLLVGDVNALHCEYSRREAYYKVAGTVGAGLGYGKLVTEVLSRRRDIRPKEHEEKIASTFLWTIAEACSPPPTTARPLRVLELGIGTSFRSIFHGCYNGAIELVNHLTEGVGGGSIRRSGFSLSITGVDLSEPMSSTVVEARQQFLRDVMSTSSSSGKSEEEIVNEGWDFGYQKGDANDLPFPNDYFDAVTCCLLLCSVSDPETTLREIRRVLRPNGAFGYIEHVAVEPQDNRRIFELQQLALDPLQQAVADNCHLHRHTEVSIQNVFGNSFVKKERFFVNMWPVSCQTSGIVRKILREK